MNHRGAFTLLEIIIAVALLTNLALVAGPSFVRVRNEAQTVRFVTDLRSLAAAFELHAADRKRHPPEASPGVLPEGMAQYVRNVNFAAPTPIGGRWDWDYNQGYAIAALCIDLPEDADLAQMVEIDTRIDNGILSTGKFRERSSRRYALIIQ